jgi:hypothetical protein
LRTFKTFAYFGGVNQLEFRQLDPNLISNQVHADALPGFTSTREGVDSAEIQHLLIRAETLRYFCATSPENRVCMEMQTESFMPFQDPQSPGTQLAVTGEPLLFLAASHPNGVRVAIRDFEKKAQVSGN